MKELVFLLEERSAKEMLLGVLPKIIPNEVVIRYIVFEGKQDLEKQLDRKLRNYLNPNAKFVVLRDQDNGDCKIIKTRLNSLCPSNKAESCMVRIACHALETFYLADLKAIGQGFEKPNISTYQEKSKYRNPDEKTNPEQLLKEIVPEYQKVSGSRLIGPFLDPENQRSKSFKNLIKGIRKILDLPIPTPLFPKGA